MVLTPMRGSRSPLRVGLLAPPAVPVPPPVYGGTEVVVNELARGLTALGHGVALVATGDSTCPVPMSWTYDRAMGTLCGAAAELRHVIEGYEALSDCDVIHDHTLLGPLYSQTIPTPPVVTTNHSPFTPEVIALYRAVTRTVPLIAISHAQRASAPSVDVTRVIHHGIHLDDFPAGDGDGGYVAFLGRMSPDKGPHRAIVAARKAGVRLLIAAKMWEPDEQEYFEREVEPLLDEQVEFVGEVGGEDKVDLLGGAAALLNPIQWNEPFGLVMIEAMACGTPVLGYPFGAAPEIVVDGETGFLCDDEDQLADAIGRIDDIDRRRCRAVVAERFSTERMVADHVELYRTVVARSTRTARPATHARARRRHAPAS